MDRHIGIVLAGGGLLGDFQVGALKYLWDSGKVTDGEVACIAGTSVGAINGVILATGPGCTDRLERFWLQNVVTPRDILEQEMWFEGIAPLFERVIEGVKPTERILALHDLLRAIWKESRDHLFEQGLWGIVGVRRVLTNALTKKSLYSTAVLRNRLELVDLRKAIRSDIALRLYAAELETGDCTCFCTPPSGKDTVTDECAHYVPCTTRQKLADAALASAALPGVFPPLEVDGKFYVDGSVREVVPFKGAVEFGAVDKIYVILCMPRLGEIKKGAEKKGEGAEKSHWEDSHLLDVAMRSAQILVDELVNDDLEVKIPTKMKKKGFGCCEIAPLVTVHGMTDLDVGRIKINMDQGYMRAYDEAEVGACKKTAKHDEEKYEACKRLSRLITEKRLEIWRLEDELIEEWSAIKHRSPLYNYYPWHLLDPRRWPAFSNFMGTEKVDTEILTDIRREKRKLKDYVDERLKLTGTPESLPDCYEEMYLHWEQHNWDLESPTKQPLIPTPWDRFDLKRRGTHVIPAEEPPEIIPHLLERAATESAESQAAPEST